MKIKKIKKLGKRKVYNILMKKNHNFLLSNNILSSNSECKGMIEGQDDLLLISEMPSAIAREVTCGPLKSDRRMVAAQIRYISMMPVHQVCVVARGQKAKILKRIAPPRTRYWKDEYGSFTDLWRKEQDKWLNVAEVLFIIKEEYKKREEFCLLLTPVKQDKIKKKTDDDDFEEEETLEGADESFEEQPSEVLLQEVKPSKEISAKIDISKWG